MAPRPRCTVLWIRPTAGRFACAYLKVHRRYIESLGYKLEKLTYFSDPYYYFDEPREAHHILNRLADAGYNVVSKDSYCRDSKPEKAWRRARRTNDWSEFIDPKS